MSIERPEQDFKKLLSSLQLSITSNEQLLADLFPSLESGETKLRRQEFQAALDIFYLKELAEKKIITEFFTHLRRKELFEEDLRIEKNAQERRNQEVSEIEKRNYNDLSLEEQPHITIEKIQQAIDRLILQIKRFNEIIQELAVLENLLKVSIGIRLEKIQNNYQKMEDKAKETEVIKIKYSYFDEKKEKKLLLLEVRLVDIFNYLKEKISKDLRTQQIKPNEIFSKEREAIKYFLNRKIEESILKNNPGISQERLTELNNFQRIDSLYEQISNHVQKFREERIPSINEQFQQEIALLAADQSQYQQIKIAKKVAQQERDDLLASQEKLQKKLELTAAKIHSHISPKLNPSANSAFFLPAAEKLNPFIQGVAKMIDSIKKIRQTMEKIDKTKILNLPPMKQRSRKKNKHQTSLFLTRDG